MKEGTRNPRYLKTRLAAYQLRTVWSEFEVFGVSLVDVGWDQSLVGGAKGARSPGPECMMEAWQQTPGRQQSSYLAWEETTSDEMKTG